MRIYGIFSLVCLIMLLPGIIAGCKPARGNSDEVVMDTRTGIYLANVEADCLARCERSGDYGTLTHNGCVYGCEEITRTFDFQGKVFKDWQSCEEAVYGITEDKFLADYDEMCMTYTDNIHRQRGCLDAVRFYYAALNPSAICQPLSPMYYGGPKSGPGAQGKSLPQ